MRPLLGLAGSFQRRHNPRPTRRLRQDATVLSGRVFMDGLRGMGGQLPMLFSQPMTIAPKTVRGAPGTTVALAVVDPARAVVCPTPPPDTHPPAGVTDR